MRANEAATRNIATGIIQEIQLIDPSYRPPRLSEPGGFPRTVEGRNNYLNTLRMDRAAAIYRLRGDYRPLQVETLRLMQRQVDHYYQLGQVELRAGRLSPRLSNREALGNYTDMQVRDGARVAFASRGINWQTEREIGIQRREYDRSGGDLTYRVPDVRVGNVVFDATLSRKTPGRAQIRGFFFADSAPAAVIIVRPTELGGSYLITRPAGR